MEKYQKWKINILLLLIIISLHYENISNKIRIKSKARLINETSKVSFKLFYWSKLPSK